MNSSAQAEKNLDAPHIAPTESLKKVRQKAVDDRQMDLFNLLDSIAYDPIALAVVITAADAVDTVYASLISNAKLAGDPRLASELVSVVGEDSDFTRVLRSAPLVQDGSSETHASDVTENSALIEKIRAMEDVTGFDESGGDEVQNEGDMSSSDEDDEHDIYSSNKESKPERLQAGDSKGADTTTLYLASLRSARYDPPTQEAEAALGVRIRAGDITARDELVNRNMRFVALIARKYIKTGRPFDDLIQAGSEGLITAATKYDPSIGRFTTMAAHWIRQRIQRAVNADASMRMPAYLPGQEARLKRLAAEASTPEEREHLEGRAAIAAKRLESRRRDTVSLDAVRSGEDDEGTDMMSLMESEAMGQDERMEQIQIVSKLHHFASRLGDDRAKNIFMMRIGMHPDYLGENCTLATIADVYTLSRERVRQIYTDAAGDIATAMEYWAKGAKNLPDNCRRGLLNPGKAG